MSVGVAVAVGVRVGVRVTPGLGVGVRVGIAAKDDDPNEDSPIQASPTSHAAASWYRPKPKRETRAMATATAAYPPIALNTPLGRDIRHDSPKYQ
ncbi:MAG: hypothetical protein M1380_05575 [Chloroflexi bacterium]|nr:hypothetical protein [Chloroflexota bacterium]